jgi:uncharacterized damage-inducible protein DinB
MTPDALPLAAVLDGWDTYQASLIAAVAPRSRAELVWRPALPLRSAGQLASHIAIGRIGWFARMDAPGSAELMQQVNVLESEDDIAEDAGDLVVWLEASWGMVADTLRAWSVADLAQTYRQPYQGKVYAVSRQWTIWRIIAHDLHHGGELALTLGLQGIALPELGDLGGHLTEPPLAT